MPAAALAVHELRFRIAYGSHAPHVLAAQGHAYLSSLAPWIVLIAALTVGASLGDLAQRWAGGALRPPRRHAGLRLWLAATLLLVATYAGQELLEGFFATGHPGGLDGVFGGGGWWALPAAVCIGGLLALALRASQAIEALGAPRGVRIRVRLTTAGACVRPTAPFLAAPAPLARAAAGRAPPRAGCLQLT